MITPQIAPIHTILSYHTRFMSLIVTLYCCSRASDSSSSCFVGKSGKSRSYTSTSKSGLSECTAWQTPPSILITTFNVLPLFSHLFCGKHHLLKLNVFFCGHFDSFLPAAIIVSEHLNSDYIVSDEIATSGRNPLTESVLAIPME